MINVLNASHPLPSIVVAGHGCLDILPEMGENLAGNFNEIFRPGRLLEVGSARMFTGGSSLNTGLALHRLGIPVRIICKTGADAFGEIIRKLVESEGLGLSRDMISDPQVSTSYSIIISPPGVDRIFLHNPGANNSFSASDIDYRLVSNSAIFHFGYPSLMRKMYLDDGEGLVEVFQLARQTGTTTSMDMCYPDPATESGRADWAYILKATLPYVDIFLPSLEELLYMLQRSVYEKMALNGRILDQVTPSLLNSLSAELLSLGVRIAVIKLGEKGVYLRTAPRPILAGMGRAKPGDLDAWADKELWAPCFKVDVAGTTGAGDALIAGFLSSLLRGLSPEKALIMSAAVGACNVESPDAIGGLLSWEQTVQRVESGWQRLPLVLDDSAWYEKNALHLWKKMPAVPKLISQSDYRAR